VICESAVFGISASPPTQSCLDLAARPAADLRVTSAGVTRQGTVGRPKHWETAIN
jgi:hypothetical protein